MASLTFYLTESEPVQLEVGSDPVTIGRAQGNSFVVEDASVSSSHALISETADGLWLQDLGSTNGTKVNGKGFTEGAVVPGDEIIFGSLRVLVNRAKSDANSANPANTPVQTQQSAAEPATFEGAAELKPADSSVKPASFGSASPFPKRSAEKNTAKLAAFGLFFVAIAAFALGVFTCFTIPKIG